MRVFQKFEIAIDSHNGIYTKPSGLLSRELAEAICHNLLGLFFATEITENSEELSYFSILVNSVSSVAFSRLQGLS